MDTFSSIVSSGQNYLSTILNLTILLSSINVIQFFYSEKCYWFLLIPFVLNISSVIMILRAFQKLLDFTFIYTPEQNINPQIPFEKLDWVFCLQIFALILSVVYAFFDKCYAKKK